MTRSRFEQQLEREVERGCRLILEQGGHLTDEQLAGALERLSATVRRLPKPRRPDTALNRNAKAALARLEQQRRDR